MTSYWVSWFIYFISGIVFWIVTHFTALPVTSYILTYTTSFTKSNSYIVKMINNVNQQAQDNKKGLQKLYNLRRYFRSQVYCFIATVAGAYIMLTEYTDWPISLLHHWSDLNLIFFTLAVTYWVVTCVEDILAGDEVSAQLSILPGEDRSALTGTYIAGLYAHHFITMFAYMWSISTQKLGGLCVMGLLFEAPVIIMNFRDIAAAFEEELEYPYNRISNHCFTIFMLIWMIVFHLCRTLFCLLWPISLLIWRDALNTLPMGSQIVYHYLGASFNYVAITLVLTYMHRYILEDMEKMKIITKPMLWRMLKVKQDYIDQYIMLQSSNNSITDDLENRFISDNYSNGSNNSNDNCDKNNNLDYNELISDKVISPLNEINNNNKINCNEDYTTTANSITKQSRGKKYELPPIQHRNNNNIINNNTIITSTKLINNDTYIKLQENHIV